MRTAFNQRPRVYLAGPEVFLPESSKIARERKILLAGLDMDGVFPLDSGVGGEGLPKSASAIFKTNCGLIDSCHALIANATPFRGPSADVGTAWEIGYACGQAKPVVAYSEDLSTYRNKVFQGGWSGALEDARDRDGNLIEDFGGIDNLMITESVIAICPTFEEAADTLRRFFDQIAEHKD
jgi:nucleoside 2-deoxyribosyltransferase